MLRLSLVFCHTIFTPKKPFDKRAKELSQPPSKNSSKPSQNPNKIYAIFCLPKGLLIS